MKRDPVLPTTLWLPLLLLAVAWNGSAAWGGSVWFFHDLRHHHFPWRAFLGDSLLRGELPLWAPIGHGFPLLADGQTGVLYPPNLLLYPWLPTALAFAWSGVAHQAFAAIGGAYLARTMGRSVRASMVAGIAWGFSGFVVSHLVYFGMFAVLAWLPWMVGTAIRAGRGGWIAPFGLSVGLAWLAGHPQLAWTGTLAAVGLGAWAAFDRYPGDERPPWPGLARLGAGLLLAGLIALPQVLSSAELAQFSPRDGGLGAAESSLGSLPPEELPAAIFPSLLGLDRPVDVPITYDHRAGGYQGRGVSSWEDTWYLGIPVVILAAAAGRTRRARPLWVLLAVAVVAALGSYTPLYPLFRWTVGAGVFRFPVRSLALATLAAGQLAAIGLDRLGGWLHGAPWRADRFGRAVSSTAFAALVIATLARAVVTPSEGGLVDALSHRLERAEMVRPDGTIAAARDASSADARATAIVREVIRDLTIWDPRLFWPAMLSFGTAALVMASASGRIGPRAPGLYIPALLVVDLMSFGLLYNPRTSASDVAARPPTAVPPLGVAGGYRTAVLDRRIPEELDTTILSANLGLAWGFEDPEVPSPLRIRDVERWNELDGLGLSLSPDALGRWRAHRGLSRISGVRWIYSTAEIPELPTVAAETVATRNRDVTVRVYEDTTALPRMFVVGCAQPGGDDPIAATAALTDPAGTAIADVALSCRPGPAGTATMGVAPRGAIHAFDLDLEREALVVLTETRYPGQQWVVDGEAREAVLANGIFQGMVLPAGRHHVVFVAAPAWLLGTILLSMLASLAATATLAASWRANRNERAALSTPAGD